MQQRGFTLIELSIVLVILGLLVASIVGGRALVHQAELQNVIRDFTGHRTAINTFRAQYIYMPGDLPDAQEYWGPFGWDGTGILNGDGNGFISHVEGMSAWRMMDLAEIIPSGTAPGGHYWGDFHDGKVIPRDNIPGAKIDGGGYMIYMDEWGTFDGANPSRRPNIVFAKFGGPPVASHVYPGIMIAKDARTIDQKMDDGHAGYGKMFVQRADDSTGCTTGTHGTAPGSRSYLLSDTTQKCIIYLWLD